MKIWIVGLNNTYNLGDPLLLHCVQEKLQQNFPAAKIEIVNVTGDYTMNSYHVPDMSQIRKKNFRAKLGAFAGDLRPLGLMTPFDRIYLSEYKSFHRELNHGLQRTLDRISLDKPDLVLFGGGQMFMHSFILPIQAIVNTCGQNRIPVIFHSCGFGPINSYQLRNILTDILKSSVVKSISIRDMPDSTQYNSYVDIRMIESIRKDTIIHTDDMGLWASNVYAPEKCHPEECFMQKSTITIPETVNKMIGLGVINSASISIKKEIRFYIELMKALDKENLPWQIFTNGYPEDELIANEILKAMVQKKIHNDYDRPLLYVPKTPQQLYVQIAGYRSIISFRLHSHIIAASSNVPSVALAWDYKLPQFFASAGCSERCLSFPTDINLVLRTLFRAEKAGWNQEFISKMKHSSLQELINQIGEI